MKQKRKERGKRNAWKRVLLLLYTYEPTWSFFSKGIKNQITDDHPICKELNISARNLNASLDFLKKQKLIEIGKDSSKPFILTTKGFSVALDIEKHYDLSNIQIILIILTAMIVITSAFGFISGLLSVNSWALFSIYVISFIVVYLISKGLIVKKMSKFRFY